MSGFPPACGLGLGTGAQSLRFLRSPIAVLVVVGPHVLDLLVGHLILLSCPSLGQSYFFRFMMPLLIISVFLCTPHFDFTLSSPS